jgi:hypothetical protein
VLLGGAAYTVTKAINAAAQKASSKQITVSGLFFSLFMVELPSGRLQLMR